MKKYPVLKSIALLLIGSFTVVSCTVVRQGEFGVKRTLGKYNDKVYTSGLQVFNPFTSKVVKISGQTENIEVSLVIPSREGLSIQSEVSILYRVKSNEAPDLLRKVGIDYEGTVILPVFRSAVSDVTSKYYAKDMHSGNRAEIEVAIRDLMMKTLEAKGLIVEAVLLKSISLPRSLAKAIEDKLEAEQQAQRMEFVLQQERQEADRMRIKAEGVRDANQIIAEGLTPAILQYKSIEAWVQLAMSPNSKIVFSNGSVPMMLNPETMSNQPQSQGTSGKNMGLVLPLSEQ
ncbi:MAG: prohibitin family protein [Lewinellaceae bacterium]|nr:prohibitin family protein [Lewinellaceae bacterium]